ncbi:hypothetical protein LshimejAT787_1100910 [Lyophyllum shimeji]|uniref:Uncharacterized protein n=1 Tax=Lyophyllum shimeji TaxID=47721 RepID=A0A9P3PVP9_LYOSH|nr:hypothetical protein LshimejAT787_1100910 [Lyophyllum shimeji]
MHCVRLKDNFSRAIMSAYTSILRASESSDPWLGIPIVGTLLPRLRHLTMLVGDSMAKPPTLAWSLDAVYGQSRLNDACLRQSLRPGAM